MVDFDTGDDRGEDREDLDISEDDVVGVELNDIEMMAFLTAGLEVSRELDDPAIINAMFEVGDEIMKAKEEQSDEPYRLFFTTEEAATIIYVIEKMMEDTEEYLEGASKLGAEALLDKIKEYFSMSGVNPANLELPEGTTVDEYPHLVKLRGSIESTIYEQAEDDEVEVGELLVFGEWANGNATEGSTGLKIATALYKDGETPEVGSMLNLGQNLNRLDIQNEMIQGHKDWFPDIEIRSAEGDTMWVSLAQWVLNTDRPRRAYDLQAQEWIGSEEIEEKARDVASDMGFDGGGSESVVEFPSEQKRNDVHDAVKGRAQALSQNTEELRCLFDIGQTIAHAEKNEPYDGAWLSLDFDFEAAEDREKCAEILKGMTDPDLRWLGNELD